MRVGQRIEIPSHYDLWMQGARFGTVTALRGNWPGQSAYALVKMDHPKIKHRLKLWKPDWKYAKEL